MRYMGSKSKIAKYIVPIIQSYIDSNDVEKYIEPFVGGANIIDKVQCKDRYGFDKNKYLIALLKRARDGGELYPNVSRELYKEVYNSYINGNYDFEDWEIGNVGLLASYNGRWFDGGYAKPVWEKTKHGTRYRDYYLEGKNNLLKQSENLQGIKFIAKDYKELSEKLLTRKYRRVIYCDPPYWGTRGYVMFGTIDQKEFWNTMRKWSKYSIVLISGLDAPDDFECIWEMEVTRSLHATDKIKATEKLFKYRG